MQPMRSSFGRSSSEISWQESRRTDLRRKLSCYPATARLKSLGDVPRESDTPFACDRTPEDDARTNHCTADYWRSMPWISHAHFTGIGQFTWEKDPRQDNMEQCERRVAEIFRAQNLYDIQSWRFNSESRVADLEKKKVLTDDERHEMRHRRSFCVRLDREIDARMHTENQRQDARLDFLLHRIGRLRKQVAQEVSAIEDKFRRRKYDSFGEWYFATIGSNPIRPPTAQVPLFQRPIWAVMEFRWWRTGYLINDLGLLAHVVKGVVTGECHLPHAARR